MKRIPSTRARLRTDFYCLPAYSQRSIGRRSRAGFRRLWGGGYRVVAVLPPKSAGCARTRPERFLSAPAFHRRPRGPRRNRQMRKARPGCWGFPLATTREHRQTSQVLGALDCLPKVDQRNPRAPIALGQKPAGAYIPGIARRQVLVRSACHAIGAERFPGASLVVKKIAEVEIALRMKLPD